MKDRRMKNPNL